MNKYDKINSLLYYLVIIMIFTNIISEHKLNFKCCLIYIFIYFILIAIDHTRWRYLYKEKSKYYCSLIVSTILCSILVIYAGGYTFIYFSLLIYPTIILKEARKKFLLLNFLAYMMSNIIGWARKTDILVIKFWREMLIMALWYSSSTFAYLYSRYQVEEKRELEKSSLKLAQANEKLKEYSKKVEELTIVSERNRVAQEIHDSLGHSLTALIMQLDYVEKIIEINPKKAKEIIIKAEDCARNSMTELRQAVYCLKDKDTSKGLVESMNEMILNITSTEKIKVNFNPEDDFENLKPEIKNIIYKTVKEALTNGIKHGNADEFSIMLNNKNEIIILDIKDNGQGCSEIIKGNGLSGIENRVNLVGGKVKFNEGIDRGFQMFITIPFKS